MISASATTLPLPSACYASDKMNGGKPWVVGWPFKTIDDVVNRMDVLDRLSGLRVVLGIDMQVDPAGSLSAPRPAQHVFQELPSVSHVALAPAQRRTGSSFFSATSDMGRLRALVAALASSCGNE